MDQVQRRLAVFFARLGSIPTVNEVLTPEQVLQECGQRLTPLMVHPLTMLKALERRRLEAEFKALCALRGEPRPEKANVQLGPMAALRAFETYPELGDIHWSVRSVLHGLIAGNEVECSGIASGNVIFRLDGDKLVERFERLTPTTRLYADFIVLLRQMPFPFRACRRCSATFVRMKRQLYCSRHCASQAIESARKDSKREYMRKYMADRRARLRRAAAKRKDR